MNKSRIIQFGVWGAAAMLAMTPIALAEQGGSNNRGEGSSMVSGASDDQVEHGMRAGTTSAMMDDDSVEVNTRERSMGSATGTMEREREQEHMEDDSNASSTGEQHRSMVAERVKALLKVADRVGGIGEEVRTVAREMASSSDSIDEARNAVEHRAGWLTFLFGSDYKNLGQLRSEIVTTQNQINRLMKAASSTTDSTAKDELESQIADLQDQASTTAAFVKENESKFSLLGWFFRLFSE